MCRVPWHISPTLAPTLLQGDSAKGSRQLTNQALFALWKDADPDIPILKPRRSTQNCNSRRVEHLDQEIHSGQNELSTEILARFREE